MDPTPEQIAAGLATIRQRRRAVRRRDGYGALRAHLQPFSARSTA